MLLSTKLIILPLMAGFPFISSCSKSMKPSITPNKGVVFNFNGVTVDQMSGGFTFYQVQPEPTTQISFTDKVDTTSVAKNISLKSSANLLIPMVYSFSHQDSTLILKPASPLSPITSYSLVVLSGLQSVSKNSLPVKMAVDLVTALDTTNKFPIISDSALLDLVEQQTFKYFWDFGYPGSGMARERNTSGDIVTTGGSGFGVMAILVGIQRNFITRSEGLGRISEIVSFLSTKAQRFHGAFPHWMNGGSGAVIPFSSKDDGADLVETSYMMQGLLCARQYFNSSSDSSEIQLRASINNLWNGVEWNWFRQNNQNQLYWHWSPDFGWAMNMPITGWNEAMIVYALAASSNTDSIPKIVYDNGWARNGAIENGNTYYGVTLPLGPALGGPLFFSQYSFLGLNPHNLSDAYANYWTQNEAHVQINYNYCLDNPHHFNGYSSECWGLTASDDDISGYSAHAPDNDDGVISPTAAISSLPYSPKRSMAALRFFYYKLGDKLWGPYGFTDAFNLSQGWFASSYLAIDQGPEIDMIENYRSGLLWNLFMSCPEIKRGMQRIGFQSSNW
ncbi:MAG: glucoamylase family protein [Chitinophagaceae bacterium]